MKKTLFSGLILIGLAALNPSQSFAAEKYPASNFEPTVIYIDKDAVAQSEQPTTQSDSKYPAANFESKVVYIDKDLVEQSQDKFDPKYPAAYFKPKVIYP